MGYEIHRFQLVQDFANRIFANLIKQIMDKLIQWG
jgi:hypothetical protein